MDGDCYRECCYQCEYANTNRVADLTVGDFWGIAKSHPDFDSPKGVSSVFVNTEKGLQLFHQMKLWAYIEKATLEEGMIKQWNLVNPSKRPIERDEFYNKVKDEDFIKHIRIGIQLKERIKAIIPAGMLRLLKSF